MWDIWCHFGVWVSLEVVELCYLVFVYDTSHADSYGNQGDFFPLVGFECLWMGHISCAWLRGPILNIGHGSIWFCELYCGWWEEVSGVWFWFRAHIVQRMFVWNLVSIGTLLYGKCMGVANMLLSNPSFGIGYASMD